MGWGLGTECEGDSLDVDDRGGALLIRRGVGGWELGEAGVSGGEVLGLLDAFPVYEGVGEVEGVKNEGDIGEVVDGMVDDRSRDGDLDPNHRGCALVESHNEMDEGGRDMCLDRSMRFYLP